MTKQKSKKQQYKIAAEAVEQQTASQLRQAIKLLKRLPNDFRDITPGSPDWEKFADITNRRKEMEKWANGPVLCLKEPNTAETMVLGQYKLIYIVGSDLQLVLKYALEQGCSWIYLPDEEPKVIAALNVLLSRFKYSCRVRGQIMSERTGRPIGVIH